MRVRVPHPLLDRRALLAGGGAALAFAPSALAGVGGVAVRKDSAPGSVATLREALELAARANGRPFRIRLGPGVYSEKLTVSVPNLTIEGEGERSILTYGTAARMIAPDGQRWGTGRTATLAIEAPDVTLRNLTIRNDFDFIRDRHNGAGEGAQAVALLIGRGADRTHVDRCSIEGYQDTLYVNSRARFDGCRIMGGVDFIFGGGAVWFDRCRIVTRHVPDAPGQGYVSAPSTPANQRFGLVFWHCRIDREAGVPDRSTYLGRPWRAGGNMALLGSSVFLRCRLEAHIRGEGWTSMGYPAPDGVRRMLAPEEARLFEYQSTGPGAAPAGTTRRVLSDREARDYTPANVLAGWRPRT